MKQQKTGWMGIALGGLLAGYMAFGSDALTNTPEFPAAKLQEIEKKAAERDFAQQRLDLLQQENNQLRLQLNTIQSQIGEIRSRTNPGRILDLEKKALQYAYLKDKVNTQEQKILELERQLAEEKALTTLQVQEIEKFNQQATVFRKKEKEDQDEIVRLKETLKQVEQGNYEWYEVKEGDTWESIAALPNVYGDGSKATVLRQFNKQRVADPERPRAGEAIIVPRFTTVITEF